MDLGEETITDLVLLEIQRRHPAEIRTAKFSKYVEGRRSGADWEWWLGAPGKWLGLRIQAKKLNSHTGRFEELAYSNAHGRQVDLLLASSAADGVYPLYCFYSYWKSPRPAFRWLCGSNRRSGPLMGCSLSSASEVRHLIDTGRDTLEELGSLAFPWSCLVCCQVLAPTSASLPERALQILEGLRSQGSDRTVEIRATPPPYVAALIDPSTSSPTEGEPPDISHVLVMLEGAAE